MEIVSAALLVIFIYFFLDLQSKMKKLEKRVKDLESLKLGSKGV